jgi:hypothetical protein
MSKNSTKTLSKRKSETTEGSSISKKKTKQHKSVDDTSNSFLYIFAMTMQKCSQYLVKYTGSKVFDEIVIPQDLFSAVLFKHTSNTIGFKIRHSILDFDYTDLIRCECSSISVVNKMLELIQSEIACDAYNYKDSLIIIEGDFGVPDCSRYSFFQMNYCWDNLYPDESVHDFFMSTKAKTNIHIVSCDQGQENEFYKYFEEEDTSDNTLSYYLLGEDASEIEIEIEKN